MGRTLGDPDDPLLVSVRSGAKFSMPGMMDTILNLGLNDRSVKGLARLAAVASASPTRSYARLLSMYAKVVLELDPDAVRRRPRRGQGGRGRRPTTPT